MKKTLFALLLIFCLLLCAACDVENAQESSPTAQISGNQGSDAEIISSSDALAVIDPELLGVWVSADEGEREMVERLYFYEDGSLIIELDYEGNPYGTLYGSYTVDGHSLLCDITEGTTPYQVTYGYRIDGRVLTLTDDDGPADYLRTS